METTSVFLTDEQLLRLDGIDDQKIQQKIDRAKFRLAQNDKLFGIPEKFHDITRRIIEEAVRSGKLVCYPNSIRHCPVCEKSAGYATYSRSSRYHRKGATNYSKPLKLSGVELAERFISIDGSADVGMCRECWDELQPLITPLIVDIEAEIPEKITGVPPKYKAYDNRKCKQCGWEGHEGQMLPLPAMMGGYYPGQCPECGAKSLPFGPTMFEFMKGRTVVSTAKHRHSEVGVE